MIIRKTFKKLKGRGSRAKMHHFHGWYLFGFIPLYVRKVIE